MTEESPYLPPETDTRNTAAGSARVVLQGSERGFLIKIAKVQRRVLFSILAYLCLIPLNLILRFVEDGHTFFVGACVIVLSAGALTTYQLATLFHSKLVALLYTAGLVVPLLGLIILFTLNQQAITVLKARGIKVGLLGANPDNI